MSEKLYKLEPLQWRGTEAEKRCTTPFGVIEATTSSFSGLTMFSCFGMEHYNFHSMKHAMDAAEKYYRDLIGAVEVYGTQPAPSPADALASIFAAADKLSASGSRGRFDQAFAAYVRHPKDEGVRKLAMHVMMSELAQVEVGK